MCVGFNYLTKHNLKHSLSLISILISPLIKLFTLGNRKLSLTLFESSHGSANNSSLKTF